MSHYLSVGQLVGQRYVVRAPLGRGGMAAVYAAFDPKLHLDVALKVLPTHLASDPTFVARFEREGQTLAKLTHPHILRLFDLGHDSPQGLYYLVLELLKGGTLKQRLRRRIWSVDETVALLKPAADALDYAHQQRPPVIHRDLKPANIMFDQHERLVISDFGLARMLAPDALDGREASMLSLTLGQVVGTPSYMAPEQAEGHRVGPAADLYALGVIAFELLTGTVPFQADTPLATMLQVVSKPLPLPRSVNPELAPSTERVLLRALARDPAYRFKSAAELVHALAASDVTHQMPLHSTIGRAVKPRSPTATMPYRLPGVPRRQALLAASAVASVLLVGGGLIALASTRGGIATDLAAAQEPLFQAVPAATATPLPTLVPPTVATQVATVTPTPRATNTPVPTIPPTPTATPTPAVADVWREASGDLDTVWGSDWPRAIAILEAFHTRFPSHAAAVDKLYAALVEYARALVDQDDPAGAVAPLQEARALDAAREEAPRALLQLTPIPTPTPNIAIAPPAATPARRTPLPPQRPPAVQVAPPAAPPLPPPAAPRLPAAPPPPPPPVAPPTKVLPFQPPAAPPTKSPFRASGSAETAVLDRPPG